MLAELMRLKQGIAIAGTHGKTTTTSLVASVLAEAGVDPTFVIGGRLNSAGANSRARQRRLHRGRGRRVGRLVPEPDAGDGGGHQHRRRPHGDLRPRLRAAEGAPSSTSCTACRSTARPSCAATTRRARDRAEVSVPGHQLRLRRGRAGARGRRARGRRADALHRAAAQRRRAARPATSRSTCRASTTCATRWRRSRWRSSSSCPTRRCGEALAEFPASAGASSATATLPARRRRRASR